MAENGYGPKAPPWTAPRYILAYGSNLDLDRIKSRCPGSTLVGIAWIPGYRLLFKQSFSGSYATVEQDANWSVPAVVYQVGWQDEQRLDRFEGCPRYYYKKEFLLRVKRLNGRMFRARQVCIAYIMHEDRPLGRPDESYFRLIDDGYLRYGFETDVLDAGLSASIGEANANAYLESYMKAREKEKKKRV